MYISVIVPYKDGEKHIDRFMEGILNQVIEDTKYEIVFVDNLSSDNTRSIIASYVKKYRFRNICVEQYVDKPSSYAARNFGVKSAKGDVLVFTDVDCRMDSWFLLGISNHFLKDPDTPLAGKIVIEIDNAKNYWEVYDACSHMNNEKMLEGNRIVTANFAISRYLFESAGEFAELISSGDSEYGERLKAENIHIEYNRNVVVFHPSRKSYKDIEEKLLRIAYGQGQRARIDEKNLFEMRVIYFMKAFNFLNIERLWKKMKEKVGFVEFMAFSFAFTKIRIGQVQAFTKGFWSNDLERYNK